MVLIRITVVIHVQRRGKFITIIITTGTDINQRPVAFPGHVCARFECSTGDRRLKNTYIYLLQMSIHEQE